jgi:hypothetical protein
MNTFLRLLIAFAIAGTSIPTVVTSDPNQQNKNEFQQSDINIENLSNYLMKLKKIMNY